MASSVFSSIYARARTRRGTFISACSITKFRLVVAAAASLISLSSERERERKSLMRSQTVCSIRHSLFRIFLYFFLHPQERFARALHRYCVYIYSSLFSYAFPARGERTFLFLSAASSLYSSQTFLLSSYNCRAPPFGLSPAGSAARTYIKLKRTFFFQIGDSQHRLEWRGIYFVIFLVPYIILYMYIPIRRGPGYAYKLLKKFASANELRHRRVVRRGAMHRRAFN